MNLKIVLILLLLFTTVTFVGCYTKIGYYEPVNLKENQQKHIDDKENEKIGHDSDSDIKLGKDESEGYYGRRKRVYDTSSHYGGESYWRPYPLHPYRYYPPPFVYPSYYGYGYYPSYGYGYGYRSYYPYSGYNGRYRGTYPPTSRSTYKRGSVSRNYQSGNRRTRASRSVRSSNPRSARPQRRSRN